MLRLAHIAVIFVALLPPVFGQVPPHDPLASARPTPLPEVNSAAPPTTAPAPGANDETVTLQFPNSDVVDVLHLYEELTGKKLVMDNNVVGKVNIFISKPVSRDEAVKIIEMNLLLNGYTLVPAEGDIVKVIGNGKNPRSAGVPIISDPADIPDGDHVISYLFKLHYADPQELQQVLGQYLSPPSSYTSFLALPKSSSILVTESSSVIRTLVRVIDQVDIPPAEVVSEFIKLERADASKVVDMLKDVFEKDSAGTNGLPGGQRGVRPIAPGPQPGLVENENGTVGLSEESVIVGKIKVAADVRTNRIHVITRPINMPFVRKLIAEFDANVDFAKPVTRPLRFISASDVLPVLVQALTEPGENQNGGGNTGTTNPNPQQNQGRNGGGTNTNGLNGSNGSSAASTTGSNTASDSTATVSEELSTQPIDTTPKAVTVGNSKIIADQRANAIIILGNREVVVKVEKILDEMDVRAPQVALTTVIGELTLNNDQSFGIDYFLRGNQHVSGTTSFTGVAPAAGGGSTTTTTDPTTGAQTTTTNGGNIFTPGAGFTQLVQNTLGASNLAGSSNVYVAAGNTLAALIHALDSTGRFRVISRPMVFTSNNKKAIIASGQEIPVPTSTLTNANVGTTTTNNVASVASSVEFKKVALQLEVVPLINSDKEVSLDILQKIDSLVQGQNVTISGNSIPTIATRYIRTNVTAPNGGTIILGGLIQDTKTKSANGIPYLDRLPVVGGLFRSTSTTHDRTELIVLMRPEVTLTPIELLHLRQRAEGNTHFGAELDQADCPDCPPDNGGKQTVDKQLPAPDLPRER